MSRKIQTAILTAVVIVTLAVASVAPLCGQAVANAQIQGLITDPSGAVVPNARVTARQTNTGFVRRTVTSANGSYLLPNRNSSGGCSVWVWCVAGGVAQQ
jgi:hypothetical protein